MAGAVPLANYVNVKTLLSAVTATGAGTSVRAKFGQKTFQAYLSSTTTPSATIAVEGSNNNIHWVTLGTITLSTSGGTDGFATDAPWSFIRGNVTAISGTSAAATLLMGA